MRDNLLVYDNTQINALFGNKKKERESMFVYPNNDRIKNPKLAKPNIHCIEFLDKNLSRLSKNS